MFIPNHTATYYALTGYNFTGEALWAPAVTIPCSVVSLLKVEKKSPIRTELAASKANADEDETTANILIPATMTNLTINDKLVVNGIGLRFITIEPRIDVLGRLDHFECRFEAWPV